MLNRLNYQANFNFFFLRSRFVENETRKLIDNSLIYNYLK